MFLKSKEDVEKFLNVVNDCNDKIIVQSLRGDQYNLKSKISCSIAIGKIVEHKDDFELFCYSKQDEAKFLSLFKNNPQFLN